MKDRIPGAPGQYSAVIPGGEYSKIQRGEPFAITLTRDDRPVVEGTPYSKAAVLPDEVAEQLCPGVEDPTPAHAFGALKDHVINTSNPHGVTAEQVGAAPAGCGLGEIHAPGNESWNSIYASGFLRTNLDCPDNEWWYGLNCKYYDAQSAQIAFRRAATTGDKLIMAIRNHPSNRKADPWNEWEYVNPPMIAGVEYRTMERWNEEPVYTKLVAIGFLPNNDAAYIANVFPAGAGNVVISGYGMNATDDVLEHIDIMKLVDSIWCSTSVDAPGYIGLRTTNNGASNYYAEVVVKYTKMWA